MQQNEAIFIAKVIRNMDVPQGYKEYMVKEFLPLFRERVPFFYEKRFIDVALQTLPEKWPRDK